MNEILSEYGLYIGIGIGVLAVILTIIMIIKNIKSKSNTEIPSSILDIDISGVEDKAFEYGYEKEDTIIMPKVEEKTPEITKEVKEEKKTATKKKSTTKKKTTTKKTTTSKSKKKKDEEPKKE